MTTFHKPSDIAVAEYTGGHRHGSPASRPSTLPAWRAALLGTVAAGALMLGQNHAALAACALGPGVGEVTCTGDESDGVLGSGGGGADFDPVGDNITTINVNNLNQNIQPNAGVDGIRIESTNDVIINSDTTTGPGGPFQIITTGLGDGIHTATDQDIEITSNGDITAGADGIDAVSVTGNVTIVSTGNVTGDTRGIAAFSPSGVTSVSSTGDVSADAVAIFANGSLGAEVISNGNVSSEILNAIAVFSNAGGATVSSTGGLSAGQTGIYVDVDQDIQITSDGPIVAGDDGISADSANGGITISSTGSINAVGNGLLAYASQDVGVTSSGDITSQMSAGIDADSDAGNTTVSSTGGISADTDGIFAESELGTQVTSEGGIVAGDDGIFARAFNGAVNVSSLGEIDADINGIDSISNAGNVTINQDGNVTAGARGINAVTNLGGVFITQIGDITAGDRGISGVASTDNVEITSTSNINAVDEGIFADSALASVTVSSTGNIDTQLTGILVGASQGAQVTSEGNITATGGYGIRADVSAGSTTLSSTGNINASGSGILGFSSTGTASVVSNGEIIAGVTGLAAISASGAAANVTSNGSIDAQGRGIVATAVQGAAQIISEGGITSGGNGIDADALLTVAVTSEGDITSTTAIGINATSDSGSVGVESSGDIYANGRGIYARADQDILIVSSGAILSETADGIFVGSFNGNVGITHEGDIAAANGIGISGAANVGTMTLSSTGNIEAGADAIFADAAEDVQVTSVGDIASETADGIDADSANGSVTVSSTGTIDAAQYGIRAFGTAGVDITTSGGTVDGGTIGVAADSGNGGITIENQVGGTITGSTYAIAATSVTGTTVNNSGTVTGDIGFVGGAGSNLFDNQVDGVLNAGASVRIGAGSLLNNAGTLSPGGAGTVETTEMVGNLVQTESGVFEVDVDEANATADRINVSGTADLAGTVRVQAIGDVTGPQSNIILSAAGGVTDNGLGVEASPALQAELSFPNANDVVLNTDINFLPPAGPGDPPGPGGPGADPGADPEGDGAVIVFNENQTNLGENLNDIFAAGVGGVAPVIDALLNGIVTVPDYLAAFDQLIPEVYLNTETAALFAAERFNDKLLSCPQAGPGYTAISQGQCMWLRYDGRWSDRDGTFEHIGFEEDAHGFSGGAQVAVAPQWTLGVAIAYENADLDTDTGASADSDRYMLGGVIKYQSGPTLLALVGSVGSSGTDVARSLDFGGFNATARSSFDVDHMGATFHAAYLMDRGSWYAKPFVDVNVTHVDRESVQETGGGAANLNVSGSDETYFSVTPALELGATIDQGYGRAIRPYVRAGVTFYSDTDQSLLASFVGAPAGVGAFQTNSEFDDVYADLEAGLTLFNGQDSTVSAGYEGRFGDDVQSHGIFVKGTRTF